VLTAFIRNPIRVFGPRSLAPAGGEETSYRPAARGIDGKSGAARAERPQECGDRDNIGTCALRRMPAVVNRL